MRVTSSMKVNLFSDAMILESWHKNAAPWTAAVRLRQIASRRLVTDQAIVEAVMARAPRSVLDIGCGEGWLCRTLAALGVETTGVDAVPELVAEAQRAGPGTFRVHSYESIAAGDLPDPVEAAVCNFSLLGKESVEGIVQAAPRMMLPGGRFVIQTLHPVTASTAEPYHDGWRRGSWVGFDAAFTEPAPWYFRTMASWLQLLRTSRLQLLDMREPIHPETRQAISVIFILAAGDKA
jgi:2-polyprenyl-3-methyl-5-hydroxy-6-metoxy-1,4-benzoquinol methylase